MTVAWPKTVPPLVCQRVLANTNEWANVEMSNCRTCNEAKRRDRDQVIRTARVMTSEYGRGPNCTRTVEAVA